MSLRLLRAQRAWGEGPAVRLQFFQRWPSPAASGFIHCARTRRIPSLSSVRSMKTGGLPQERSAGSRAERGFPAC